MNVINLNILNCFINKIINIVDIFNNTKAVLSPVINIKTSTDTNKIAM